MLLFNKFWKGAKKMLLDGRGKNCNIHLVGSGTQLNGTAVPV